MSEDTIMIIVKGEVVNIKAGTTIAEVLKAEENPDIVGALINQDLFGLNVPITVPVTLTPVYRRQRVGREIVNRTSGFILESIFARPQYRHLHFQIGQSLHHGFYYELLDYEGPEPNLEKLAAELDAAVTKLIAKNIELKTQVLTVESACLALTDPRGSMTKLLDTWPSSLVPVAELDGFTAIMHGPVAPSTGYSSGIKVVPFPRGIILQFTRQAAKPTPNTSKRLVATYRESRQWNRMINVATVGDLNEAVLSGRIKDVIRIQEGLHEKKIIGIADTIMQNRDKLRLICIAGPSSSGKTTFVQRLSVQLKVNGIQPVIIGLDDYYRDRADTPLDSRGQLNFEVLEALDVPLLTDHLQDIVKGKEIKVPHFDFETGRRVPPSKFTPLQLRDDQMLLIEGIHGLNPTITDSVPEQSRFRIFVSALTQLIVDEHTRIPTSDGRLLRRIVRDRRYRGTLASGTIEMWPRVREGEQNNIFPYQESCDVTFNSSLIYEAAVLKTFAWRYLLEVPRSDPGRVQAQSLLRFLDMFVPIFPDNIPLNSILREFIGGSGFAAR